MPAGKDSICVTIILNQEEMKLLEERIEYLKAKSGATRVSKSEAIRHAIRQTGYKEDSKGILSKIFK
jgi:hypothetical protein